MARTKVKIDKVWWESSWTDRMMSQIAELWDRDHPFLAWGWTEAQGRAQPTTKPKSAKPRRARKKAPVEPNEIQDQIPVAVKATEPEQPKKVPILKRFANLDFDP